MKLRSHDLEDPEEIKKLQDRGVREIMARAYKVPFYRKKFDEAGLKPSDFKEASDLVKFPLTTKEEIRNWMLEETEKEGWDPDKWVASSTSGSTGIPLTTYLTPQENAMVTANWLRLLMLTGYDPVKDSTLAFKDPKLAAARKGGRDSIVQKLGFAKRNLYSFFSDGKTILNILNGEKPDLFYLQRSKLEQMLMYAKKEGIKVFKPKIVCIIGENVDPATEILMEKYFPGRGCSTYGSQETGACTITKRGTFHDHVITADTHVVLVLDKDNKPADEGKMVITNLFIKSFPIINYDIGDSAVVVEKNGVRYLKDIYGKKNDNEMLRFPDGSTIACYSLYSIMELRTDIMQFCFVQDEPYHMEVQLVEDEERSPGRDVIEKEILKGLEDVLEGRDVEISFNWLDEIPPDANGKRRFVVSKVK